MAFIAGVPFCPFAATRASHWRALVAVALLAGCSSAPKRKRSTPTCIHPMASRSDEQARDVTLHAISLVGTRHGAAAIRPIRDLISQWSDRLRSLQQR